MTGQFAEMREKQAGQSSVEMVLVISLTLVLCFLVVTRFTNVQESVFTSASSRQALISAVEEMDSSTYSVKAVQIARCSGDLRVNVEISPKPDTGNSAAIAQKVENAVRSTANIMGGVCMAFNQPEKLECGTPCT